MNTKNESGLVWDWDPTPLLYWGGAALDVRNIPEKLDSLLGNPDNQRSPLILKIKNTVDGRLIAGGSVRSALTFVSNIRKFYTWADSNKISPTIQNVVSIFMEWSDYLFNRVRDREIKRISAYGYASSVASVLNEVLDRDVGLMHHTRLRKFAEAKPWSRYSKAIDETFQFGEMLHDICTALTVDAIQGKLPITIPFRNGKTLEHWSGLRSPETLRTAIRGDNYAIRQQAEQRKSWESEISLRTRMGPVNLRIQAEMLCFIAQTGMNVSQARKLKIGRFMYQSYSGGYLVRRIYKDRKKGEVEFEIFSEYRQYFENYIDWRNEFFPQDVNNLLFPFLGRKDERESWNFVCAGFSQLREVCRKLDVVFIVPSVLRKVRINWWARRTGDFDSTAEVAQHTKKVLFRNYLKPDPDLAATEISLFFQTSGQTFSAPAPGRCVYPSANPIASIPAGAPLPDCASPSGCLFCSHLSEVESFDHVWALISFRRLKIVELTTYKVPLKETEQHPALSVIQRINEKLNFFKSLDEKNQTWIKESEERIREGSFHPNWTGFIELAEALL